jgi:hypothetical protein
MNTPAINTSAPAVTLGGQLGQVNSTQQQQQQAAINAQLAQ